MLAKVAAILTRVGVVARLIVEAIPNIREPWKRYKEEYPDEPTEEEKKQTEDATYTDVTNQKGENYGGL